MQRIRTDFRALILNAALVGALAQPMTANGLLRVVVARNTFDAYMVQSLGPALTGAALLYGGHLLLRRYGVVSRAAYALLGALACLLGLAPWASLEGARAIMASGQVVLWTVSVLVAGAVFGFLYVWRAGLEPEAEAPAAAPDGEVLVETGEETWFDGPVQVRTSAPVMFVAALSALCLFGLLRAMVLVGQEVHELHDPTVEAMTRQAVWALGPGAVETAFFAIAGTLPVTGMIFAGHMLARALKRSSYLAYGLIGLFAPVLLGVVLMFAALGLGLMLAVPSAIAMLVYRNMAGLEPVPVREDVRVRERRDLVGADHARRRFARVVKG